MLGLPVYNFGAPSTIKSWVDHLIAPGLSLDPATHEGLLGGRDLVVLASRGGGYAPARRARAGTTPSRGCRTACASPGSSRASSPPSCRWPASTPGMADLIPMADQSLAAAEGAVDELWLSVGVGEARAPA